MPTIDTKKPAEVINSIFFNMSCLSNKYVAFGAFCNSITSTIFVHDKLTSTGLLFTQCTSNTESNSQLILMQSDDAIKLSQIFCIYYNKKERCIIWMIDSSLLWLIILKSNVLFDFGEVAIFLSASQIFLLAPLIFH